jgi:hypothetical protein
MRINGLIVHVRFKREADFSFGRLDGEECIGDKIVFSSIVGVRDTERVVRLFGSCGGFGVGENVVPAKELYSCLPSTELN